VAERIQRKRTKGWRMPEGAVYVGRPTKWGNPYRWSDYPARRSGTGWDGEYVTYTFTVTDRRRWSVTDFQYQYLLEHPDAPSREDIRRELAGKDLACWCPAGQPCHADVLLKIANEEAGR
jgi:hypothetical protein